VINTGSAGTLLSWRASRRSARGDPCRRRGI
jgi:hypothetical protein